GHADHPEQEADNADRAQDVLRSLTEAGEELDGQEVEEALDEAAHAVLGPAEAARAMVDLDLADLEAAGRGQDRHATVQLAIEAHLAEDRGGVALHAAVVIVQLDAGQPAHHAVKHAAGPDLVPGIVPPPLPAADHVLALGQGRQEARDLRGIVLEVG